MSERINIAAELMSRHCAFTECQDGTTLVYCRTLRAADAALRAADAEIATLRTRLQAAEAERDALASEAVDRLMLVASLRTRAEQAEAERDEARALKAPPTVDELNAALMNAAVAKVERDVAIARAEQAEAERERVETFLNATWLTCWAKGVGDVPDREPPTDIEDAARDVSTFILGCNVQISELLAEVARLRGEYARGLREAAGVLRDAAKKHRNEADASRSVAASGGHVLAADILESYANVIELLDAKEGGG